MCVCGQCRLCTILSHRKVVSSLLVDTLVAIFGKPWGRWISSKRHLVASGRTCWRGSNHVLVMWLVSTEQVLVVVTPALRLVYTLPCQRWCMSPWQPLKNRHCKSRKATCKLFLSRWSRLAVCLLLVKYLINVGVHTSCIQENAHRVWVTSLYCCSWQPNLLIGLGYLMSLLLLVTKCFDGSCVMVIVTCLLMLSTCNLCDKMKIVLNSVADASCKTRDMWLDDAFQFAAVRGRDNCLEITTLQRCCFTSLVARGNIWNEHK